MPLSFLKSKNSRERGALAEKKVAGLLEQRGFKILERNWRLREGEIDLIAEQSNELFFVEVKARSSDKFGSAFESISLQKQERLRRTALRYLQRQKKAYPAIHFMAVAVNEHLPQPQIECVEFPLDLPGQYY